MFYDLLGFGPVIPGRKCEPGMAGLVQVPGCRTHPDTSALDPRGRPCQVLPVSTVSKFNDKTF